MPLDLFQQITIRSLSPETNLIDGPAVGSESDQLIMLLEQVVNGGGSAANAARVLPADPLVPVSNPATEDESLWFLTDHDERVQIELEIADVTPVSGPYNSTELWFLHMNTDGRGPTRFP